MLMEAEERLAGHGTSIMLRFRGFAGSVSSMVRVGMILAALCFGFEWLSYYLLQLNFLYSFRAISLAGETVAVNQTYMLVVELLDAASLMLTLMFFVLFYVISSRAVTIGSRGAPVLYIAAGCIAGNFYGSYYVLPYWAGYIGLPFFPSIPLLPLEALASLLGTGWLVNTLVAYGGLLSGMNVSGHRRFPHSGESRQSL